MRTSRLSRAVVKRSCRAFGAHNVRWRGALWFFFWQLVFFWFFKHRWRGSLAIIAAAALHDGAALQGRDTAWYDGVSRLVALDRRPASSPRPCCERHRRLFSTLEMLLRGPKQVRRSLRDSRNTKLKPRENGVFRSRVTVCS